MRSAHSAVKKTIGILVGLCLVIGSFGWFTEAEPRPAAAQQTGGFAVSASVTDLSEMSVTTPSVAFPAGAPGRTVPGNQPIAYTVTHTGTDQWSVNLMPVSVDLSSGTNALSMSAISWKRTPDDLSWAMLSPTKSRLFQSNTPTSASGQAESIHFQISYPETAAVGNYSGTINLVLE